MNLDETDHPALLAFRQKRTKHATFEEAVKEALFLLDNPRAESVIVLLGPSGVGKSTLVKVLEDALQRHNSRRIELDPGFLPYISIKIPSPLDGNANWKDILIRALHSGGEALISRKSISRFEVELDGEAYDSVKHFVREELRRCLEKLVLNRNVPVIILDEASHLLRVKVASHALLQFEILKSLSVELSIPILLVGAYDLLGVLEGTGQLIRRSDVIHFKRYCAGAVTNGKADEVHFKDLLNTFLNAMDMEKEPDLIKHSDYFMAKSVGCAGILKDWLDRAMKEALKSPKKMLTRQILEHRAYSNKKLMQLTREAIAGEQRLRDVDDAQLAALQGLQYTPSLDIESTGTETNLKRSAERKGRVGRRQASRDPVGASHA
jgi:hypothetical protein